MPAIGRATIMNETKLCVNCFQEIDSTIGGGAICPVCSYDNTTPELKGALRYHSLLQERYEIGRVKCANSEGFTYAALDKMEDALVDIREFYPATLAYRDGDKVFPGENSGELFDRLYNEFLDMARGLIRLKELSSLVTVNDLFWQNNTAYIVYEHFDSVSLRSYVEGKGGRLPWNTVRELFLPMVNSLSSMHGLGTKHLGISPETLRVCKDGKMRLGEFSIESVRRVGRGLQPDLVVGCPAYEQYTKNMECDEITDVYAFGACLLYAVTGQLPEGANKRMENQRLLISKTVLKELPPHVIQAIANALRVRQEERTGSFQRLRAEIIAAPTVVNEIEEAQAVKTLPKTYQNVAGDRQASPKLWLLLSFVVTGLILAGVVYYVMNFTDFSLESLTKSLDKSLETSAQEVVIVPDMVGEQYKDWVDKMKDGTIYNFTLKVGSQEFSEKIPEGQIISQSPAASEHVEKGGTVKVVVSRGSTKRVLPKVAGMKFTKALELLEQQGFEVVKEEGYNDTAANGVVLWYSGDVQEGDELPYGTVVTVAVSLGKQKKSN